MTSLGNHLVNVGSFDKERSRTTSLVLKGERLCLDFTNTKSGRGSSHELDHLQTFDDLMAWAEHAGIFLRPRGDALRAVASERAAEANFAFQEAIALRETLYRLFTAIAERVPAPEEDVIALNRWVGQSYPNLKLMQSSDHFAFGWPENSTDLSSILWPIVQSAADVLTKARLDRIKSCPGLNCGWLFLDVTKNGKRRWCDMATCGNREKSRLHYRRGREIGIHCD